MNKTLRNLVYVGVFLVPLIPFVVAESLLFPFISGKAFLYRVLVEIIFGLWIGLAIRDPEYRPRASWILKSVGIFALVVLIADIFALDNFKAFWSNYERMEGFVALAHHFAFFLVAASVMKTRSIWNKFFATNVGASAMMAIYAFLQLAGLRTINQGGVRVDGLFGNATYLAIYMVFNLFFAALLFVQARSKTSRWLLAIVALADLVVLYFTATRGAILGLLGGAFIALLYIAWKSNKGDPVRKFAFGLVAFMIVAAGIFWSVRNTALVQQSPVLSRFANISMEEVTRQGRYYVWPMAWQGFLERPILGWGQEGFNYVFAKNYDPRMYNQEPWFDRTHNILLDWMVNAGALGILSYLFMYGVLIYSVRALGDDVPRAEKGLLYGIIFAYLFHNLFVFDQIGSYIMFFALLAYVHFLRVGAVTQSSATQSAWHKLNTESARPVADGIVVILVVAALYFVNYIPWQQNKQIITALRTANSGTIGDIEVYTEPFDNHHIGTTEALEHVSQSALSAIGNAQATQEFKEKVFNTVDSAYKRHIERAPYDARHRIMYATFLGRLGMHEEAIPQLTAALESAPRKQAIYIERGSQLLQAGKPGEALADFKTAYELEPNYKEARFTYALGALLADENGLANELFSGFSRDELVKDDRYLSVLYQLGRHNDAIALIKDRIGANPVDTQNYLTLASIYLQAGRRQEAIAEIQKVIEIDPSFKERGESFINEIRAGRNP